MSESMISRFITFDDPRINKVILDLPQIWWSRPYEYAWVCSLVSKEHIVLDAACGICHPLKFYLCNLCKEVYACDMDERLLSKNEILMDIFNVFGYEQALEFPLEYLDKPIYSQQDISATTYKDAMFDRIICVSVLEHMTKQDILKTLIEFKRILTKEGLIAITIDYPYLDLETFNLALNKSGLSYAGKIVFELPDNALKTQLFSEYPKGLYSFRALVKK